MQRRFEGKSVLIVGASSGIGADTARLLVREGARVILVARRLEMLQEVANSCPEGGDGWPKVLQGDVASIDSMKAVEQQVRDLVGTPDYVIANAAIGVTQAGERITADMFRKTFEINVVGVGHTLLMFHKEMVQRGSGHLIAVSSLASMRGLPGSGAYSASKAAVSTFMESLRIDLRGTGVVVTTVQPGFVATPMTEKNRFKMPWLMSSEKAAEHMARAMLKRKSSVYSFPWQTAALMRVTTWIPACIYEPMMAKGNRRNGKRNSR